MATAEEIVTKRGIHISVGARSSQSPLARFLDLVCSVRLGVTLLVMLAAACVTGMLIMQQNVEGFQRYFAQLTSAQRLVYGKLGLFDIYHAWYFNPLLCGVSLNLILASLDRFPRTWTYASRPNRTVPLRWLRDQKQSAAMTIHRPVKAFIEDVSGAMKKMGWRTVTVTEKAGRTFAFAQSGVWNRFGAYAVHVGLLTIFTGGFLTAQFGATGQMPLAPGQTTDLMLDTMVSLDKTVQTTKRLPFSVHCADIQQRLIKKEGSLTAQNTIDWITRFTITDETGTHYAHVQLNQPFDYRGYRFFQASFTSVGRARNITVRANDANSGAAEEITIARDGSAKLRDGTTVVFEEFRGNFRFGEEDTAENTADYQNPAAVLLISHPGFEPQTAYAFDTQIANIPFANKPVSGYTFQLVDFEKVADKHILSVQRDPGADVVYVGFVLLFLALAAVFFFSHQRVWAAIEGGPGGTGKVILGGNTNRNMNAFDEKFKRFVRLLEAKQK